MYEGKEMMQDPVGVHTNTRGMPVPIINCCEWGANLKVLTGFKCISTVCSSNVDMSQIQTTEGVYSHLVARYSESNDQSMREMPVGGPCNPTFSKVLA